MFAEPRRARRIRHTLRIAAHRRREHLARVHDGPTGPVDCICELAATYFSKRKGHGCGRCRSRRPGRPKISNGICKLEVRDRIYVMRRAARRLREFSRRPGLEWEDDDLVLLAEAGVP